MINPIKFDINHNQTESERPDKKPISLGLPVISMNSIKYIYDIILDKQADYIFAYDKIHPIGITEGKILNGRRWHVAVERILEAKFKKM